MTRNNNVRVMKILIKEYFDKLYSMYENIPIPIDSNFSKNFFDTEVSNITYT